MTLADFGKLIAEETEKWAKVIRAAHIKAEWVLPHGCSIFSVPRICSCQPARSIRWTYEWPRFGCPRPWRSHRPRDQSVV